MAASRPMAMSLEDIVHGKQAPDPAHSSRCCGTLARPPSGVRDREIAQIPAEVYYGSGLDAARVDGPFFPDGSQ